MEASLTDFPKLTTEQRLKLLEPRPGRLRMVLDTDTFNEIDDQYAIVQALLSPERLSVEAIYAAPFHNKRSTSPGDGTDKSYDEILALLERLDIKPDGLVHRGVRDYVGPKKQPVSAPAVTDLIRRARASTPDNPLYVVAIAAISNIASALLQAPDIIDRIVVVWLGGHALEWPNTYEFNLRQDVGGAQVLLDSGVPLVLLPCMGVVSQLHCSVAEIERYVEPHGAIGAFLSERFKGYATDHMGWTKAVWDMAAVAWLLDAAWTPSVLLATPILTSQVTWSFDHSRPLMSYVRHVDRDAIMKDFFVKLAAFAAKQG
jgi:hypothetical protein